jgi:hypothetical protein
VEAQRLQQRTQFDIEMMAEVGFCSGIENYSRHLTGRMPGEPPPCLYDYLPPDALLVVDESHVTVPQLGAMYKGDRSRKETLVQFGFRLPSALDNRPLKFEEWERRMPRAIFVSATPGKYEMEARRQAGGRNCWCGPTGLIDPQIEVRPVATQVDDLLSEIHERVKIGDRVLVTTLTKRMAENLTDYLAEHNVKVRYLHSDVETVERVEIIRDLRLGKFDVLVGINLLREGLDMPEVSLVAILDADKEGFLRSAGSLIQTIGRCARNLRGKAILYADRMTNSMQIAIAETDRRRQIQVDYNLEHGIVPTSIEREVMDIMEGRARAPSRASRARPRRSRRRPRVRQPGAAPGRAKLKQLEAQMYQHARDLEFRAGRGGARRNPEAARDRSGQPALALEPRPTADPESGRARGASIERRPDRFVTARPQARPAPMRRGAAWGRIASCASWARAAWAKCGSPSAPRGLFQAGGDQVHHRLRRQPRSASNGSAATPVAGQARAPAHRPPARRRRDGATDQLFLVMEDGRRRADRRVVRRASRSSASRPVSCRCARRSSHAHRALDRAIATSSRRT